MDEIEVEIVELELPQARFERWSNVLGGMGIVPELAGDPHILSLGIASSKGVGQRTADLLFVLIDRRAIDVPIADFDRCAHGPVHFVGLRFPSPKAQGRHSRSAAQLQSLHRHVS
jgi:hypothetical protein